MSSFDLITQLEPRLRAHLRLTSGPAQADNWLLEVHLFYDGKPAGRTSFNLHGHNHEEAETVARNLKNNAWMMREIDEFLWGESD